MVGVASVTLIQKGCQRRQANWVGWGDGGGIISKDIHENKKVQRETDFHTAVVPHHVEKEAVNEIFQFSDSSHR